MSSRKFTRQDLRDAAEKFKNWGKWGPDDEIGTLNYTSPEDIIAAASRRSWRVNLREDMGTSFFRMDEAGMRAGGVPWAPSYTGSTFVRQPRQRLPMRRNVRVSSGRPRW